MVRVKKDHSPLDNHLQQLEYLYGHGKVSTPYNEHWRDWDINMLPSGPEGWMLIRAVKDGQQKEEAVEHVFYAKEKQ